MKRFLIVLLFIGITFSAEAHKFYTSITDISYNNKSKSLEVVIKLFVDDFEKAIEDIYNKKLFLGTEKEDTNQDEYISKYISSHLEFEKKSKIISKTYLGSEKDRDYIWLYIEVQKVKSLSEISIKNTLLTDIFPDQTNLINFEFESGIKSVTLHKDYPKHTF